MLRKACNQIVLRKNHLGSCDDELQQKNMEVGLRLLQLSRSDLVRPEGQEPWAGKEGGDLSYLRNKMTRAEGAIGYRGSDRSCQ